MLKSDFKSSAFFSKKPFARIFLRLLRAEMEEINQSELENNRNEDKEAIDPITMAVSAGALLSVQESALIAQKRKVPSKEEAPKPPM